jgi:sulfur carrier protein
MIAITLNGEPYQLVPGSNVAGLVDALQLSSQAIAVALNRKIIPRAQWQAQLLQPHDKVDVVRAIGGG